MDVIMHDRPQLPDQDGCHLDKLPIELLLRITAYLNTVELGSVRLACKRLERSLFHSFSREFFHKKQFMLTDESLTALVDISRHKSLAPCLNHLIIGTDYYDRSNDRFGRSQSLTESQFVRYRELAAQQFNLIRTGRAVRLLTAALQSLPSLETIDIRDFSSRTRWRDGDEAAWNSYGSTTARQQTGHHIFTAWSGVEDFAAGVFTIVVASMTAAFAAPSTRSRIRNLEVLIRKGMGLSDYAFAIPAETEAATRALLGGLRKFHIDVSIFHIGENPLAMARSPHLFREYLQAMPNLKSFRLNLPNTSNEDADQLLEFLAGSSANRKSNLFPLLEQFDLGRVQVTPERLRSVLMSFGATLQGVSFWRVRLDSPVASKDNLWANFFQRWNPSATTPNVNKIAVGHLTTQILLFHEPICVGFHHEKLVWGRDRRENMARTLSSSKMTEELQNLAKETWVLWPKDPDDSTTDDDDSSASDEDIDDGDDGDDGGIDDGDDEGGSDDADNGSIDDGDDGGGGDDADNGA